MSIQQSLLFAGRMVKKAGFKNKKKPHVLVMRLTRMSCRSTIIKKLMKILYALLCVPSSLLGSFCLLIFLPVFPSLCRLFLLSFRTCPGPREAFFSVWDRYGTEFLLPHQILYVSGFFFLFG